MNTDNRFLTSLLTEFKLTAQPHVRSLWADLEELREATVEHARVAIRPKPFETLDRTMNKLAEALYAIDVSAAISSHAGQPTEAALVESGTD